MALPYRPLDAEPGDDRAAAALHRGLSAVAVPHGRLRASGDERQSQHRAAGDRPVDTEEHGAIAGRRGVCVRAVRDRRRPAADVPGLALRSVEGPAGGDRRLSDRQGAPAARAARAGGLEGERACGGRAGRAHPQQLQQRGGDRGQRVPIARGRADPEVDARGLWPDGLGGDLEGATVHRGQRRRDPAADRGWRDGLPGGQRRGMRGADAGDPRGPGPGQDAGPPRQGACARALPDAALSARLSEDLQRATSVMTEAPAQRAPLVLVSNRGPVTFGPGGEVQRGSGGLVTALTGLASHREAVWIASAMSEQDAEVSREHGGRAFPVRSPAGGEYEVRLVTSDPEAYDRFYNVFANPMLWFIQHYLWDLSNAPDIRRHEIEAFEFGYNAVNDDLAEAVIEELEGAEEPVVMIHDYHLYTLPGLVRRARPDAFLHHFVHIPWTQSDAWRVLPTLIREEIFTGLLANDIIGFHPRSYRRNFLQCCRDLMDLEVDFDRGVVYWQG